MPENLAALKIDRTRERAGRRVWPWLAGAVLLGMALTLAPQALRELRRVEVSVAPVIQAGGLSASPGGSVELSAAGYVVADRQSTLACKITGRLDRLNVVEAQKVKKGDLIAEIEHADWDAQIAQAQADLAEATVQIKSLRQSVLQAETQLAAAKTPLGTLDAQMRELEIKLADAQRKLERDKKVAKEDALAFSVVEDREFEVRAAAAQIITAQKRRLEQEQAAAVADAALGVARAAIQTAQARENSVAAHVKVLQAQVADAFIYAPYDGVVTEKAAEVGEIIAPVSIGGAMARGSIVTLADLGSLQAEVDVAEAYIRRVRIGGRAAISVDAFPDRFFPGKVLRVLPRANRSKATVQVRVAFTAPPDGVVPDMGVRVKFLSETAPPGAESGSAAEKLVVPRNALQSSPNGAFVWLVNDGQAHRQAVTAGELIEGLIEIQRGLSAGQKVVTTGAEKLTDDGQKVKLAE